MSETQNYNRIEVFWSKILQRVLLYLQSYVPKQMFKAFLQENQAHMKGKLMRFFSLVFIILFIFSLYLSFYYKMLFLKYSCNISKNDIKNVLNVENTVVSSFLFLRDLYPLNFSMSIMAVISFVNPNFSKYLYLKYYFIFYCF